MHEPPAGASAADTLIVAQQGRICDGLSALLDTLPQVDAVARAVDAEEALRWLRAGRFGLVLLDAAGVTGPLGSTLARLRAEAPGTDGTLIKGFPADQLVSTIEGLAAQGRSPGGGRLA